MTEPEQKPEENKHDHENDHPGVLVPPPVLFGGAIILGLILQGQSKWFFAPVFVQHMLGPLLVVFGILLAAWAAATFLEAGTNVLPHKPSHAVVTSGPFRFSRNPMYVGLVMVTLGAAMIANTVWILILLVPAVLILDRGVIIREEAYLARKFGDPYLGYCRNVRRWL